jgi:hypothetical protein
VPAVARAAYATGRALLQGKPTPADQMAALERFWFASEVAQLALDLARRGRANAAKGKPTSR